MESNSNEQDQQDDQVKQVAKTVVERLLPEVTDSSIWFDFSFNGLATPPIRAVRSFFRLFAALEVLPGTWGVCYLPGEDPFILSPGLHWLKGLQAATTLVQFVDARLRHHELYPVTGASLDGWNVTLQAILNYEVVDPIEVARATDPVATLEAAAQAALLAQIEAMPHETLLGTIDTAPHLEDEIDVAGDSPAQPPAHKDKRGLEIVERGVLERLQSRPGLAGLRVVDVAVVNCYGDERLVDILREEALGRVYVTQSHRTEAARAELKKMQLEMQVQTTQAERAAALIQAESKSQLAAVEQQMRLLEARTEAEVQEIRQAQEAREAERKRLAEEWRTAKELDLRSMEYQHAQTLAIIQGTTEITSQAAKSGMLGNLQGNSGRLEIGNQGDADAVVAGIQSLRGFREKIAPPATHFLPRPGGAGFNPGNQVRIQAESLRLERIRNANYELIIRHGEIVAARVWFSTDAPSGLAEVRLEFTCPEGYPFVPPQITILRPDGKTEYPLDDWDAGLFLADLVTEIVLDLISETP